MAALRQVLQRKDSLLEGPCVLPGEGVAFSDVLAGGIFLADERGDVRTLLERRRGIGGLVATAGGALVATGRNLALVRDGGFEVLYEDPAAQGFNDLTALRDGSVVAGVLRYRPLHGEDPVPGELVRLRPGGGAEVVAEDILWPNGLVETPDGALLVSDYARGHVKRIEPGGAAAVFHTLADGQPDGVALDAEGALWIATGPGGSLVRVLADGTPDMTLDVPADFVSSVCFAGPDLEELVVTTIGSLLRGAAPAPGAPVPLADF